MLLLLVAGVTPELLLISLFAWICLDWNVPSSQGDTEMILGMLLPISAWWSFFLAPVIAVPSFIVSQTTPSLHHYCGYRMIIFWIFFGNICFPAATVHIIWFDLIWMEWIGLWLYDFWDVPSRLCWVIIIVVSGNCSPYLHRIPNDVFVFFLPLLRFSSPRRHSQHDRYFAGMFVFRRQRFTASRGSKRRWNAF